MPYLSDAVRDFGLSTLIGRSGLELHLCSAEPASFTEATTISVGVKDDPAVSGPGDATGGGRRVTVDAVSDGAITADGTASHWALVDTTGSVLLAANALSAAQPVTSGNSFSLTAIDITIPDL